MSKSNPKSLTYDKVRQIALEIFNYDKDKLNIWWMAKNPHLDDRSPFEVVRDGQGRELVRYLERCGLS